MRTNNILELVTESVAYRLNVSRTEVVPGSRIKEDLHGDELGILELAMDIKEKFGVTIAEHKLAEMTVEDIVSWVSDAIS